MSGKRTNFPCPDRATSKIAGEITEKGKPSFSATLVEQLDLKNLRNKRRIIIDTTHQRDDVF